MQLMRKSLSEFIDKHKYQTGFVLGNGPSLRNFDSSKLESGITIAVNSSILKAPKADYYFSCDTGMVLWESWLTLRNLKCDLILATNDSFQCFESRIKGNVFDGIDPSRIKYISRKKDNIFDLGNNLVHGSSSVHAAVHFAYVMGCSPIVLVGCDLKYVDGKKRFYDFPNQPKDKLINPSYEKYRRPLSKDNPGGKIDGELSHHIRKWNSFDLKHIEILDASDSSLIRFRKITIQEAMNL